MRYAPLPARAWGEVLPPVSGPLPFLVFAEVEEDHHHRAHDEVHGA